MSAPRVSRRRARRGEGERLRDEILAAAERLLLETGSQDRVSVRAVADAVGVTPPAIYMHFRDKDELFFSLCELRFGEFRGRIREAFERHDDPLEALAAGGREFVRFGLENSSHYRVLFMSEIRGSTAIPLEERAGYRAFADLVEAVERCMRAGRIRVGDPVVVATALFASLHGVVSLYVGAAPGSDFPWPDVGEVVDTVIEAELAGLSSRPPKDDARLPDRDHGGNDGGTRQRPR